MAKSPTPRTNLVGYLRAESLIRMQDDTHVEQGETEMRVGVFEYLIEQQQISLSPDRRKNLRGDFFHCGGLLKPLLP